MAIDDNTVYGLTGAQIKELPGKIDAVRGVAKELTVDDYDYPSNNPDSINLWNLEPGIYHAPQGVDGRRFTSYADTQDMVYVIIGNNNNKMILNTGSGTGLGFAVSASYSGISGANGSTILNRQDVINALSSTDTSAPLSAAQGKVLKGLIDAIVVPTKVSDLTNDSGYQTASDVSAAISTAISSVMTFKGTVATVADLPSGAAVGDVYNVTATGDNYVWDGSAWDKLSGTVDLSNYYTKTETDTALATKANASTTYTKTEVDTAIAAVDDVVYIPITITDLATMTFSVPKTATEVAAMLTAGKKVAYRMSIPTTIPSLGLLPGDYDFSVQYHFTNEGTDAVAATMTGQLGGECIGTFMHVGSQGQASLFYPQRKIDSSNKLDPDYIDQTYRRLFRQGTAAPTTSTYGEVGDLYLNSQEQRLYVCTGVSNNTYTWQEISVSRVSRVGNVVRELSSLQAGTADMRLNFNNIDLGTGTITYDFVTIPGATTSNAGAMTSADKTKLDGIATGAEANVQSDWNQADTTADDFIKNKPTIPTVNNATLTIQKNGTTVQTFTANASSNKTANIEVPVITITTTDPGEGGALAANNFIAVYTA